MKSGIKQTEKIDKFIESQKGKKHPRMLLFETFKYDDEYIKKSVLDNIETFKSICREYKNKHIIEQIVSSKNAEDFYIKINDKINYKDKIEAINISRDLIKEADADYLRQIKNQIKIFYNNIYFNEQLVQQVFNPVIEDLKERYILELNFMKKAKQKLTSYKKEVLKNEEN